VGGNGKDRIEGRGGEDWLIGWFGDDFLDGGDGFDHCHAGGPGTSEPGDAVMSCEDLYGN
jgi:hypothetical protein